ncbi:hypothetical protein EYC80_008928 [Monilinia laxa]|uniref:Uncharacterized protein n=1 Tax=Monilinia laxa TaxID=61186 RepID=A0A5N6K1V4_MONLA|nr:hypothetical protein EYC80_008928 [Monilinia laxa]
MVPISKHVCIFKFSLLGAYIINLSYVFFLFPILHFIFSALAVEAGFSYLSCNAVMRITIDEVHACFDWF